MPRRRLAVGFEVKLQKGGLGGRAGAQDLRAAIGELRLVGDKAEELRHNAKFRTFLGLFGHAWACRAPMINARAPTASYGTI